MSGNLAGHVFQDFHVVLTAPPTGHVSDCLADYFSWIFFLNPKSTDATLAAVLPARLTRPPRSPPVGHQFSPTLKSGV